MSSSSCLQSEREWCTAVVDAYGATGVVLTESTLDLVAVRLLGHAAARAAGVLPLAFLDGKLFVASARPLAPEVVAAIAVRTGAVVVAVLAAAPLMDAAIEAAYQAAARGERTLPGLRALSSSWVHLELVRPSVLRWLQPLAG